MENTEKFYEASEDAITKFNTVFEKKTFPNGVKIKFIGNSKLKKMIDVTLLSDKLAYAMEKDLFVMFNEDIMDAYGEDEVVTILIEQELDKIRVDNKSGKLKSNPLSFITSPGVLSKYGLDKVSRANNIDELSVKQYDDKL